MATSGTFSFTLDLTEIIEDAYERIGVESRSGYDLRTARRSLDLLMLEWQNRGLNLWTIKQGTETLVPGTASYTLDPERLDIIEAMVRTGSGTSQFDSSLTRISISTYAQMATKNMQGPPSQFWVERQPEDITVHLWPVPDSSQAYTLVYYYMEQIEDTGRAGSNNMDVPSRFLPALISGLAYYLALKTPDRMQMVPLLKEVYEEQWTLASDSAREKASVRFLPSANY